MKKYFSILLLAVLFSSGLFAQSNSDDKIIAFHPSSGKTIDVKEKNRYEIFNEYSDSAFELAQLIKHKDGTYSILIKTRSGKSIEKSAAIAELDAIYAAIEKLDPAPVTVSNNTIDSESEKRSREERRTRERRTENAIIAGDIALRTFFVLLDILFVLAQAAN